MKSNEIEGNKKNEIKYENQMHVDKLSSAPRFNYIQTYFLFIRPVIWARAHTQTHVTHESTTTEAAVAAEVLQSLQTEEN